jgi:2-polyprenyl-6-methoxyphenol hydroxylase-like FAD-dependent oxidoreductase
MRSRRSDLAGNLTELLTAGKKNEENLNNEICLKYIYPIVIGHRRCQVEAADSSARVLIVGAGPVGQLAALLLSHHGVGSLLIDKRLTTLSAPKAHAINARTLEICDSIGVSAEHLRELGANANDGGQVRFLGTLTGPEFGCLPYERQDEGAFEATPFPLSNIPQPVFEEELIAHIRKDPDIDFRRGMECKALCEVDDHVDAVLAIGETGEEFTWPFDYVIAADGAGSKIRQSLDIEMEGPEALANYLMIHFSADLRPLTEGRRGVLYFLFEPGVRGTLISYDQSRTWVLMHPWNPEAEQLDDYDDEKCLTLIERSVGHPLPETVVENVSPWTMTAQVAKQYRKGRIFLVGDAAHRIPPAGGLGINSGAGDVQNLAWKLAAVLRGEAADALLDTYQIERQPVARNNNEQSLTNAMKIVDLIVALHGTDPNETAERYAAVSADPGAYPELAEAVAAQMPHFDSFDLQLGYRYASPAIHQPAPIPEISDVSDYRPSWDAGAHFPHRWVSKDGNTVALQTLLPANRFTLLCGPTAVAVDGESVMGQLRFGDDFEDSESWKSQTGLPSDGALLIRPDGHIAAKFDAVAAEEVDSVMNEILARGV